jgi:hypothetical protein
MVSRFFSRGARLLVVGIAALVAISVPMVPAHATYGAAQPIQLQLFSPDRQSVGLLTGSIQFDDGNLKILYSVSITRQSSFTQPFVDVFVNGTRVVQWTGSATEERVSSSTVVNVTFTFHGSSFTGPNVFKEHIKTVTYDNPFN